MTTATATTEYQLRVAAIEIIAGESWDNWGEIYMLVSEAAANGDDEGKRIMDRDALLAERLIDAKLAGKGISFAMQNTTGISREEFVAAANKLAANAYFRGLVANL